MESILICTENTGIDIQLLFTTDLSFSKSGFVQVGALWNYFTFNASDVTPQKSRGALVILCMAAKSQPRIISPHLQSVMDIGLGRRAREDPLLARYACIALQRLSDSDRVSLGSNHKIFSMLSSLIIAPGGFGLIFCLITNQFKQIN